MRDDAITLEDGRLKGMDAASYPWLHERHRIFPQILDPGRYKVILDVAAGAGVVAQRIRDGYPCRVVCNDISPEALRILAERGLETVSFDLDDPSKPYPFGDGSLDAVISLATLEHLINIDHHLAEIRRILTDDGHLYLSTPNYSGLQFVLPYLITGRSFHDPMKGGIHRYEFYAHVRYFTYRTLIELVSSLGFTAERVYVPIPRGSTRYQALEKKSPALAMAARLTMSAAYHLLSPRWAFHPVIRFAKRRNSDPVGRPRPRKVVL
jgi:SAM-dependent methyltransferase